MKMKWWVLAWLMTMVFWLSGCRHDPAMPQKDKPHYPEPIFPGPM